MPALSLTTRTPRDIDLSGEYGYVSVAGFKSLVEQDSFAWHLEVHGNYYGTQKKTIEQARVLDITNTHLFNITFETVMVLRSFLARIGPHALARHLPVYVLSPPPEELRRRIALRGGLTDVEIDRRVTDCLNWDEEARRLASLGRIPFRFVHNDSSDGDISKPVAELKRLFGG